MKKTRVKNTTTTKVKKSSITKHKDPDSPKSDSHAIEYTKLAGVFVVVSGLAWVHAAQRGLDLMQYLESFMGMFFLIFASFKLYKLKEFAYGVKSYATFQDKSVWWGYIYPFVQVAFGTLYLLGLGSVILNGVVFLWSAYGAYIVWLTLQQKGDFHCLCLGGVIKLPLSTISFVEDFGMSVMALVMLLLR